MENKQYFQVDKLSKLSKEGKVGGKELVFRRKFLDQIREQDIYCDILEFNYVSLL